MEGPGFSRAFSFILDTGVEVFPVKVRHRDSGELAFRISVGGKRGNIVGEKETPVDEATMTTRVLNDGYSVRCASVDGKVRGLYSPTGRSVVKVKPL